MSESITTGLLAAVQKMADALEREAGIVWVPAPRDHVPCNFCGGGSASGPGCMACFAARQRKTKELAEEYDRLFPNGLEPILVARLDNPQEMEDLKAIVGREALEKTFGPDGGGMKTILAQCAEVMAKYVSNKSEAT